MTDRRFLQDGFQAQAAHVVEEKGELDKVLGDLLAAIGKTQRWGLESVNPLLPADQQETNRAWVVRAIDACYAELDDMQQVLDRLRTTLRQMDAEAFAKRARNLAVRAQASALGREGATDA